VSVVKHFITDSIKRTEIDEFLQRKLEKAGYGGVAISKTPLGTHIVVYAMRPGLVIGRGGETIKELASVLEEKFKVSNPQISVSEIEIPELNAYVVASRVASALQRGVHFRRAGYWSLNQVMEAGALGAEIIISGKLRTERARHEKFRAGYLVKCGEPSVRYMQKAEVHVQLKPGIFGVRVRIMPPEAKFPDNIQIVESVPTEEKATETKTEQETATGEPEAEAAAEAAAEQEDKKEQGEAAG
jgi:small subunit ribosomal protein S3